MAFNFRLFNSDRTFDLDKVEALIQRVATKISRETKIEKTYFLLPRMNELCEELEKESSHFEYAVFVVHACESMLCINKDSEGYSKMYHTLQKITGDRVLIVIGGDDNYKGQEERDESVLSRWVLKKIFSQFTEDYVNGVKGFIFSWEEDHHPIHEEALEFFLDPTKRGTKFVPRPSKPDVHILSFHASQPSVDGVVNVFKDVYKELGIASKPKSSQDLQINIQDHIMKYKPEYLVLVSEYENIEDVLNFDQQVQHYRDIVKMSYSDGTKLIFIITEDKKYREGYMDSDDVHTIFTRLNQDIPKLEQPMVLSWNTTPWSIHREVLIQLLTPYGNVLGGPQQYGATKQDPTPSASYTPPADVPMKRRFYYRASISCGRVVKVLERDPPDWEPESRYFNDLLSKHQGVKKATIEFKDEGDGGLQGTVHPNETKLYKIAEGVATDKLRSIHVYSYHADEKTNDELSNFIDHLGIHDLSLSPMEPNSLMGDITGGKPDYVMFSADADALEGEGQVKTVIREYGAKIKDTIEECVGQGVIIMLFGDEYYKDGDLASKEATQKVKMLTQGLVEPDCLEKLTVMTCKNRPFTTHLELMKKILKSKGKKSFKTSQQPPAKQGPVTTEPPQHHYYFKAVIKSGQITEVLVHNPPDWIPDEGMVMKTLQENNDKERKAYLEIYGNEQGDILKITVEKESKADYYVRKYIPGRITSFFRGSESDYA